MLKQEDMIWGVVSSNLGGGKGLCLKKSPLKDTCSIILSCDFVIYVSVSCIVKLMREQMLSFFAYFMIKVPSNGLLKIN